MHQKASYLCKGVQQIAHIQVYAKHKIHVLATSTASNHEREARPTVT